MTTPNALPASKEAEAVAGWLGTSDAPWHVEEDEQGRRTFVTDSHGNRLCECFWGAAKGHVAHRMARLIVEARNFAHPPTDAGVSEALAGLCPRCAGTGRDPSATSLQCHKCMGSGAIVIRAALSTAIPAGNGVPPGMAKSALDCVVHALMVLPVPIDGQGKRAWASLLEAQDILEALSTTSTSVKG